METINTQPTLVIGLGGTGVKVVQKLKKQLLAKSPPSLAEEGSAISFFCLDTEPYSKERHDPLTKSEYMPMGIGVNPRMFVMENLNAEGDYGIKTVWPTGPDGQPYGLPLSGANRLSVRAVFFSQVQQIYKKVQNLIRDFFRINKVKEDNLLSLQIHTVSSLGGETGSALIFDVPYLCKIAAKEMAMDVDITGHFVTSGHFESVMYGTHELQRTAANTYTCLRELDNLYRKNAENESGHPLWEVRYTNTIGTVDADGMPNEVAFEPPMDWIHLYDRTNEAGMSVSCSDQIFDVISQGISYGISGGISGKTQSALDSIRPWMRGLTSTGKAKPYSSMGISTLEFPIEALQKYLGYKWAEQLARLKADHPYQSQDYFTEEAADKWGLMKQCELFPLQELVLPSCPMFRLNSSNGKLEAIEGDNEILPYSSRLAEEFGLAKFDHKHRPDINEAIARNYDQRVLEGKRYKEAAENAFEKYRGKIKLAQKDHLAKVKAALSEKLASLVDYSHRREAEDHEKPILRSTDAFSHSVGDLQRALSRVINVIAAEEQKWVKRQSIAELGADPESALKESKVSILGFGGRSGQISDWSEAVMVAVTSKARAEQQRLLRSALEELRRYLGEEIKTKVDKADDQMTLYIQIAKSKAFEIIDQMKRDEAEKVVSVSLVRADDFPAFAASKTQVLDEKAEEIWRRTDELIREKNKKGGNRLIEALVAGQTHMVLGGEEPDSNPGCLEEACMEAAKEQLAKLDFQQFVEDGFFSTGKKEEFQRLVLTLDKKAGAWADFESEYQCGSAQDEVQMIDYLLYPKGAESIREILEEMKQEDQFTGNVEIVEMPEGVTEGIVKISMRYGYTLESLDFMNAFKECEMAMLTYAPKIRRSILKDYEESLCPLAESSCSKSVLDSTGRFESEFALDELPEPPEAEEELELQLEILQELDAAPIPLPPAPLEIPAKPTQTDQVNFSAMAQGQLEAGAQFILDIWAHTESQTEQVKERATEMGRGDLKGTKQGVGIVQGSVLEVHLSLPGFEVADPVDLLTWNGDPVNASFPVTAPKDCTEGSHLGTATISSHGLMICKLHFQIEIGAGARAASEDLTVKTDRPRIAFASYASQDRESVLRCLQGMEKVAPELEVNIDVVSLRSGQDYREALGRLIPAADVFFLFWSKSASESDWVEWEWRLALRKNGLGFIDPVPLEDPCQVPPPTELDSLHFNDKWLAFMKSSGR